MVELKAEAELAAFAETIGAPVYIEPGTTHGRLPMRCDHPLNAQGLPPWAPGIKERLTGHDVILVAGMDLFRLYIYMEPSNAIPAAAKLIHIDEDPKQIGKNQDVAVGVVGHTKIALSDLTKSFKEMADSATELKVQQRTAAISNDLDAKRLALQADVESQESEESR